MTRATIHVSNVTVRYGRRVAVDSLSLEIAPGAVYALLGRNGAGKSSLVRAMLGQLRPAAGSVALFGDDVWRNRTQLMERVGVVPEEADAPPEMRVRALGAFSSEIYSRWSGSTFAARLERFGIDEGSRFGDLSKGQKKQVLLAAALAISPELLILDDPTLGLDVVARRSLFEEVIGDLAERGITVLIATHDLAAVEPIADRVGILDRGRLVLDEELEALKSRFRRIRVASRPEALEAASFRMTVARQWGNGTEAVVSNYDEVAIERLHDRAGSAVEVTPMTLEEIFVSVAGEKKEEGR